MGGGELLFTFVNVMLMTLIIAALVLWRYRRAVLAGMQQSVGTPLPLPLPRPPAAPKPHKVKSPSHSARMSGVAVRSA